MLKTDSLQTPSFRDPAGFVFRERGRVLRRVNAESAIDALTWLHSERAQQWMQTGRMAVTKVLSHEQGAPALLEHEPVFFPSYPWEWTPGQWLEAARLTLNLCDEVIGDGYILKDATPLNILFSGTRPVLVDVLSVERRDPSNPLWNAYAQFVRTFLLPLCAYTYLGWPLAAVQHRRDGYEPGDLASFLSLWRRHRAPFLSLVTLPLYLEKWDRLIAHRPAVSREAAGFVLHRLLRRTRRQVDSLTRPNAKSRWSRYTATMTHYSSEDQILKLETVRNWLELLHPERVLDVGANTGIFSRLAASCGAQVVAWDSDQAAVEENWNCASLEGLPILALVANFAWPTPATGWRNQEHLSLLERARGQFDCVLILGLLHHLIVNERLPLEAIVLQLAEITTRGVILEWIPREDSQFRELCRGRDSLYMTITEAALVQALLPHFAVVGRKRLANGRSLWFLAKQA